MLLFNQGVYYIEKVRTFAFIILGHSGFHSHVCQYMQKVHTRGVNIRYIEDIHYNLWKIEYILNKANAYLCMLFFAFCYLIGGWLIVILCRISETLSHF